jgi:putative transposase
LVLEVTGIPRSTYYYRVSHEETERNRGGGRPIPGYSVTQQGERVCDGQITEWLCEFVESEGACYGYRKLTHCLRRSFNLVISPKKVHRLCRAVHILRPARRPKHERRSTIAINRTVTRSNQLWEMDLKYGYVMGEDRFFYVLPLIDVFDRSIVTYHMGLSSSADDAATVLERALWHRRLYERTEKPVVRTDNGPQFIADRFEDACTRHGISHERIPFKTPNKNAHIEAFNGILEDECLKGYEFLTYTEAYEAVVEFMGGYNEVRIHSSLKYKTPSEAYKALQAGTLTIKAVRA